MNFKKWMAGVLGTGLVMSMGVNSATAYADESNVSGSAESEAKVKFTVPEAVEVDLYDPKNMDDTIEKEEAGKTGIVTGQTGALTIDYVTTIDFGDAAINSSAEEYEFTATDHHLQVTDRRGTGTGWHITARASEFKSGGETTLPSSEIILSNGKADSPVSFTENQTPAVESPIKLVTNGAEVDVASAAPKEEGGTINTAQGVGTWIIKWLTEDDGAEVKLSVPARSASIGEHSATIIWTLADGPANNGR